MARREFSRGRGQQLGDGRRFARMRQRPLDVAAPVVGPIDDNPFPTPIDAIATLQGSSLFAGDEDTMSGGIWRTVNAFRFNNFITSLTTTNAAYIDVLRFAIYQSSDGAMPAFDELDLIDSWEMPGSNLNGAHVFNLGKTVNVNEGYFVLVLGRSPDATVGTQLRIDSWACTDMRTLSNFTGLMVPLLSPSSFISTVAIDPLPATINISDTTKFFGQGGANDTRYPIVRYRFL